MLLHLVCFKQTDPVDQECVQAWIFSKTATTALCSTLLASLCTAIRDTVSALASEG